MPWPEAQLSIPWGSPVNVLGTLASHHFPGSLWQMCPRAGAVPRDLNHKANGSFLLSAGIG